MQKTLSTTAFIISSILLLQSCVTNSISVSQRKADTENSKESTATCFVKMNDGTIKYYNTLKLVTGIFSTPHLLADGKTRIKGKQIIAYQNSEHYAISQKTFCCGRVSHVATETLPGFAVRIAKGKINIYCKKYLNGQVAADEYFLQAGDDGKIMAYSTALMNELVKDNAEAYKFFNNRKSWGTLPERLFATIHLYNNGQLMTRN